VLKIANSAAVSYFVKVYFNTFNDFCRTNYLKSTGPIWAKFFSFAVAVDDQSEISIVIHQWTLPRQAIRVSFC